MFLDSLRTGLSEADEPFLEQALGDRSRNVRATAAELLSALPGSALAARMAVRATACVALDRTGDAPAIVVEAPLECDPGMERDGVVATPPAGRGERSWWLGQLVEAAPLGTWRGRLGGRTAEEIVALPVADGWQGELHAAWCRAAVRQRDAAWSRALLGSPSAPEAGGPGAVSLAERAKLLAALDPAERAAWVAGFIATHGLSGGVPAARGVRGAVGSGAGPGGRGRSQHRPGRGKLPVEFQRGDGAGRALPGPGDAVRLEALLAMPDEREDAAPGAGGYWAEAFQRLVTTLRLRAAMTRELAPSAPPAEAPETAAQPPEAAG